MKPYRFSFSVQLCSKEYKYAYEDGDMCCRVDEEKEDGGHSGEFAWKYLCEKSKDNFYLYLDKLWKLDLDKLINKEGTWKADESEWKFSGLNEDLNECPGESLLKVIFSPYWFMYLLF